jgi:TatD DNase family protein
VSVLSDRKIVDVHAHLCDPVYDTDRGHVLERARHAGIAIVVAVGETLVDAYKNIELAAIHPALRPAAGLYPTRLNLNEAREMKAFIRSRHKQLFAIGEVGLDYWAVKDASEREIQREIFAGFIDLSRELKLPLNVHSRSAGRHAVRLLLEHSAERAVLHAFDGKASAALPAVEAGYFFSIPPSVVRSRQKQKLVKQLPVSCLLAETDSPVLGPSPNERNEPANAVISVNAIAEIKNLEKEAVTEALFANARRLFGPLSR